ncbi:TfoX N-terminal domain-containing protein [Dyella sp. OK004]|uniref:TfoX/Sxy family protein n=1 Tax=Dyella sp. OK004 TaxID=1855292 RepID=UPI0008E9FCF2|nr:TfoX/Sxy family protein [Dyella sp. OK004]SFS08633.1 TfoX N-terminal domain-containing protein [Dyella sp. OK004]
MNPALETLRHDLEDAATHLGLAHDLRFHPMFGGLMAYMAGRPCAWLTSSGLALKLATDDQADLLAVEGTSRLEAKPGAAPSRQYIVLPVSLTRDTPVFAAWLARSVEAQRAKPAPKRRR